MIVAIVGMQATGPQPGQATELFKTRRRFPARERYQFDVGDIEIEQYVNSLPSSVMTCDSDFMRDDDSGDSKATL